MWTIRGFDPVTDELVEEIALTINEKPLELLLGFQPTKTCGDTSIGQDLDGLDWFLEWEWDAERKAA